MRIGFVSNKKSWISTAVRKVTKSEWSHCFLIIDSIGNDWLVVESDVFGGVRFDLLSKYANRGLCIEIYNIKNVQSNINVLLPYIGRKYGYLQVLGFLLAKLLKLDRNIFTKGVICSELCLMWLLGSNLKSLFSFLKPNHTSPQDLHEIVSINNNFEKIEDKCDII